MNILHKIFILAMYNQLLDYCSTKLLVLSVFIVKCFYKCVIILAIVSYLRILNEISVNLF